MKSFGKQGSGDGEFKMPTSVFISSDGRFIVVAEYENSRIQVLRWMVDLCLSLETAAQKVGSSARLHLLRGQIHCN